MAANYSVPLSKVIKENGLETIFLPKEAEEILITTPDVNRPGLIFAGYENYFDSSRISFLGKTECEFINNISPAVRRARVEQFMSKKPAAIIVTRDLECPFDIVDLAPKYGVPILKTSDSTSRCMAEIIAFLNIALAERITRHGVFVEVYGEGMLILGDSGIGKSETAIELVKRGHRLIADDAVEIRKISESALMGTAPNLIRNYVELRGIGIINVAELFGMGAVKAENEINMVVNIVPWNNHEVYDRLGLEDHFTDILGVQIPINTIPITPGRNLAVILEVAAMNNRQKKMGYNAALEFTEQINKHFDENMK